MGNVAKGEVSVLQVGSQVVYGVHGVCNITGTETRVIDRKKVEYLVLEPNDQRGAKFYVPAQNQTALSKLRPLMEKAQLEALLDTKSLETVSWIPVENLRKQKYKELITSADLSAIICMIRLLQCHRDEQLAAGRKFHLSDENFLRDARKILASECSVVLGIPKEEIFDYICGKLND